MRKKEDGGNVLAGIYEGTVYSPRTAILCWVLPSFGPGSPRFSAGVWRAFSLAHAFLSTKLSFLMLQENDDPGLFVPSRSIEVHKSATEQVAHSIRRLSCAGRRSYASVL